MPGRSGPRGGGDVAAAGWRSARGCHSGILSELAVTGAVNTVIAVFLTAVGFGYGFVANLVFSQCIGFSIHLANLALWPLVRDSGSALVQLAVVAAAVFGGAVFGTILGALANGMDIVRFVRETFQLFARLALVGVGFGAVVSYVFISLGRLSAERLRRLESEKAAMEAELRLLQSQMEPHFLFNTLSNIQGLIEVEPEQAKRMLESFTAYVRTTLQAAREPSISLATEMEAVRNYLAVYQVRLGDRLRFEIDLPADLSETRIPPLLIQPLVENAVRHGLEPAVAGGRIAVAAGRRDGLVRITVSDTGVGIRHGAGGGIGLENARRRLRLLYGERGRLFLEENEPRGVRATVEFPDERSSGDPR